MSRLMIKPYDCEVESQIAYLSEGHLKQVIAEAPMLMPGYDAMSKALSSNGYNVESKWKLGWLKVQGRLTYNVIRMEHPPSWGFYCVKITKKDESFETGFVLLDESMDPARIKDYELRLVRSLDVLEEK